MKTYDELLEDEGFWQDLKRKLMENNQRLWSVIWASGGLAAYQLGAKRIAKELGINWADSPRPGVLHLPWPDLIEQLTETDLGQIRDLLEKSWGKGEKAFARQAEASQLASPARLKTIYRTEIHYSNEYAGLHQALDAGVKTRSWLAMGDERTCDICSALESENQKIPINKPFSNGEMTAHAHPSCRCRAVYDPEG
jgi:hypothetical protein